MIHNPREVDLDAMPIPSFERFIGAAEPFDPQGEFALAFESSRGCWWGERSHCKFCGINGTSIHHVAKSTARAVEQIRTLWERHRRSLVAMDTILPISIMDDLLRELERYEDRPKLFYELKTTVTENQVAALARTRVQAQPGIESLSTHLLRLMGKGGRTIRNLAFLKWCREWGLPIDWNLLFAIPGESVDDYTQQMALFSRIVHFPPPGRVVPVALPRFSPYFDDFKRYGWSSLAPRPEYPIMHPHLSSDEVERIAYVFRGTAGPDSSAYETSLKQAVDDWQTRNTQGDGLFLDKTAGLVRNENGKGFAYKMTPLLGRVLECTHRVTSLHRVLETAHCEVAFLEQMVKLGLLYIEGDKALNLSVRLGLTERGRRPTTGE
jgi:ribosomal peptide maturation radical SAM protein 1